MQVTFFHLPSHREKTFPVLGQSHPDPLVSLNVSSESNIIGEQAVKKLAEALAANTKISLYIYSDSTEKAKFNALVEGCRVARDNELRREKDLHYTLNIY
jgi:hypothetical protein